MASTFIHVGLQSSLVFEMTLLFITYYSLWCRADCVFNISNQFVITRALHFAQ